MNHVCYFDLVRCSWIPIKFILRKSCFLGIRLKNQSLNLTDSKLGCTLKTDTDCADRSTTTIKKELRAPIPGDINPLELEQVLKEIKNRTSPGKDLLPFPTVSVSVVFTANLSAFQPSIVNKQKWKIIVTCRCPDVVGFQKTIRLPYGNRMSA